MSQNTSNTHVSILELPGIVMLIFERAQRSLLPRGSGPAGLFVRYLRRKPNRGLAVIYHVDELRPSTRTPALQHASDPNRSVSLTLNEEALDGPQIRFSAPQVRQSAVEIEPSGVLSVPELGISVQAFPADARLPALAASCDTSEHGPMFQALQAAAQVQLRDTTWRLISASAEPVRYKPANRCVIRYRLVLERSAGDSPVRKNFTLFGKVYADAEQAESVQAMQQELYEEQVKALSSKIAGQVLHSPLLPQPLGTIKTLGLTLNEAVQPATPEESMLTGVRALQPQMLRGRGGEIRDVVIPDEELRLTAVALAGLHTSGVRPSEGPPRTGAKEAKRARERASLIAAHNPGQAEEVQRLAQQLATGLEALQPDAYRPAHGGFKASQLLFHSHQVFVVDFDGFCLADPALDVGYFLAYLRPSGLWYQRAGMRQWFEAAKEVFVTTYRQAMLEHGIASSIADGILERSRLYEAALIFKIATRRANRLNSARPKELSTMLNEIAACL
jgi:Phosphotransferase enzyme family